MSKNKRGRKEEAGPSEGERGRGKGKGKGKGKPKDQKTLEDVVAECEALCAGFPRRYDMNLANGFYQRCSVNQKVFCILGDLKDTPQDIHNSLKDCVKRVANNIISANDDDFDVYFSDGVRAVGKNLFPNQELLVVGAETFPGNDYSCLNVNFDSQAFTEMRILIIFPHVTRDISIIINRVINIK